MSQYVECFPHQAKPGEILKAVWSEYRQRWDRFPSFTITEVERFRAPDNTAMVTLRGPGYHSATFCATTLIRVEEP